MKEQGFNYFIGNPPDRIIRSATLIILSVLVGMIFLSAYIEFPDALYAKATIRNACPPVNLYSMEKGMIRFHVKNNEFVDKGAVLATIDNASSPESIEQLSNLLDSLQQWMEYPLETGLYRHKVPVIYSLGELQDDYEKFREAIHNLEVFYQHRKLDRQILAKQKEASDYVLLYNSCSQRTQLLDQEKSLVEEGFKKNQDLFDKKVISASVLEESEKELLTAKGKLEESESDVAECRVRLSQISGAISELQSSEKIESDNLVFELQKSFGTLYNALQVWKSRYQITAPIAGKVVFTTVQSEIQYVECNQLVLTVVSVNKRSYRGYLKMPIKSAGKVGQGQKVLIELENYPANEFGWIECYVGSITDVAREGYYSVELQLPENLKTSGGLGFENISELTGTAKIIVQESSLLERVWRKIRRNR